MAMRTAGRFLFGMLAVAVVAELALQLLPVSTATMTGYHHDPELVTYPSHHEWTSSTGWDLRNPQQLRSNAWGFAAEREFAPDSSAVALIGDSYVEASMLSPAARPAAQLELALNAGRPVYALGSPGTALLDHAQRIRLAAQQFGVRDFVLLLERSDARQSLCGSGNVQSRCLDRTTLERRIQRIPEADTVKRIARHSALAQYFAGQLKFRPSELIKATFTRTTPELVEAAEKSAGQSKYTVQQTLAAHRMVDAVVDAFFEDAAPHLQGRLVVVVDARRGKLRTDAADLIDVERARMIQRLASRGAVVVDLAPVFAAHTAASERSLEVGPYDGHMNALGVQLAMTAAAEKLQP